MINAVVLDDGAKVEEEEKKVSLRKAPKTCQIPKALLPGLVEFFEKNGWFVNKDSTKSSYEVLRLESFFIGPGGYKPISFYSNDRDSIVSFVLYNEECLELFNKFILELSNSKTAKNENPQY